MQRFLPPLLLLLILAVVAVRCSLSPSRGAARTRIVGHVQGRQVQRAGEELDEYLERFHDEEDCWFGARTYLRMGRPIKAMDTIWNHPTLPDRKDTARRFAEAGLYALGWEDEERQDPSPYEVRALVYLVEGGHRWGMDRLRRHAAKEEILATTPYFFLSYRLTSRKPMELLAGTFRSRGEKTFDVAAALASLRPETYPERAKDLDLLIEVVESADWRRRFGSVWAITCFVLGRSGDATAVEALERVEAMLEGSSSRRSLSDLALVRTGLLAAGEWRVDEPLAAHAFGPKPFPHLVLWHLEALIHRYRSGDMRSELRLRQMWEGPGQQLPDLRWRIARAFLLQETIPDDKAQEVWVPRMLRELQAPGEPLMSQALARAYLLRTGGDGAREAILETMRAIAEAFEVADPEDMPDLVNPFLEVLRALHLYG